MKDKIATLLLSTAVTVLIVLIPEAGVRILFPQITLQGIEKELFLEAAVGDSPGWLPNATGTAFDMEVEIDEQGFRKMDTPENPQASWLILGDSITFGIGVETEDTFVGKLQQAMPDTRLWNTSVIGYATGNYEDVVDTVAGPQEGFESALLFYAFNDTNKALEFRKNDKQGAWKALLAFMKSYSKLYMLTKNLALDRSQSNFLYDHAKYETADPQFERAMGDIVRIRDKLRERGVDLTVVLLFGEYQVRTKEAEHLKPQKLVSERLKSLGIPYIDLYQHFDDGGEDSRTFYLYSDSMHFSKIGHQHVFDILVNQLADPSAGPSASSAQ